MKQSLSLYVFNLPCVICWNISICLTLSLAAFIWKRFSHQTVTLGHNNESWTGDHSLWYRNPVELTRNMLANPLFVQDMTYAPEKHFSSGEGRLYSEIHWSKWWWKMQVIQTFGELSAPVGYFHSTIDRYNPPGCLTRGGYHCPDPSWHWRDTCVSLGKYNLQTTLSYHREFAQEGVTNILL